MLFLLDKRADRSRSDRPLVLVFGFLFLGYGCFENRLLAVFHNSAFGGLVFNNDSLIDLVDQGFARLVHLCMGGNMALTLHLLGCEGEGVLRIIDLAHLRKGGKEAGKRDQRAHEDGQADERPAQVELFGGLALHCVLFAVALKAVNDLGVPYDGKNTQRENGEQCKGEEAPGALAVLAAGNVRALCHDLYHIQRIQAERQDADQQRASKATVGAHTVLHDIVEDAATAVLGDGGNGKQAVEKATDGKEDAPYAAPKGVCARGCVIDPPPARILPFAPTSRSVASWSHRFP